MQFAVQASMQGMQVTPTSLVTLRHQVAARASPHVGTLRAGLGFSTSASQFLAPGLDTLQLPAKLSLRHDRKLRLESARAGVGAYDKDAFVDENEANKIALVSGYCGLSDA